MISFEEIRNRTLKPEHRYKGTVLALDPGHTTGWSLWASDEEHVELVRSGQVPCWRSEDLVIEYMTQLISTPITAIVMESYQIYDWKTADHSFSQVPTLQVIGCIKTLCKQKNIPYCSQTAQMAKQFCTDAKLEAWGFWKTGEKHARDAIRHGAYFLLFGTKKAH